jgi:hypothetical protein
MAGKHRGYLFNGALTLRVGHWPALYIHLGIFLPNNPHTHHKCMVLTNPSLNSTSLYMRSSPASLFFIPVRSHNIKEGGEMANPEQEPQPSTNI